MSFLFQEKASSELVIGILPKAAGLWFQNLRRAQTLLPKTEEERLTTFSQESCPLTRVLEMYFPAHVAGSRISAKWNPEVLESWHHSS